MTPLIPAQKAYSRALLVGLMGVAAATGLSACKVGGGPEAQAKTEANGAGKPKPDDAIPVEVAAVRKDNIAANFSGTAALEPKGEAQVVAKTSGVAMRVFVEEGQSVRAGQTLVKLDDARMRLQVQQASAQVEKLSRDYARAQQLAAERLIATADLDRIRFDLANARSALNMARLELSYTNVVAPISGVVASRSIKTGNFVQISSPIMRIVSGRELEAVLNVPESEKSKMRSGLPVIMHVDALPAYTFNGQVTRIAPVIDSGSGTFRVVSTFSGGTGLEAGMFGRLDIAYDEKADALLAPRAALLEGEQNTAVFVVRGGKAVRVPVQTGYTQNDQIEIRSGLQLGDQVITAGKAAVRDGAKVTILNTATAAAPAAKQP